MDKDLKQYGLARTQYLVLSYLFKPGRLPTSDLVARLMVEPATISGIIDTLEQKELVHRVTDPSDRRRKDIEITSAGSELIRVIPPPRATTEKVMMRDVSPSTAQALLATGRKMIRNLELEIRKEVDV